MPIPPFGVGPTPSATTTSQGKIKLAGVLGGTADLPTFAAGTTGSGLIVLQTSPTLITPALGTPSSGTLTNATGLPLTGLVSDTTTALGIGSINLGHATDTTIARSGAGDITIEGNAVYRAGGTDVPVTDGGTGRSTSTTAYGLIAAGTTATGAYQTLAAGATTEILVGGGASALPVWTTATGTGAPARAGSPTFTTDITAPVIYGGTAETSPLTLQASSASLYTASTDGRININDPINMLAGDRTFTTGTGNIITLTSTYTLDHATPTFGQVVGMNATVKPLQSTTTFNGTLFNNAATLINDSATSVTMGAFAGFVSQATHTADTLTIRQEKQWSFIERSIFNVANSGTFYNPQWYSFYAANQTLGNVRTGAQVLLHASFYAEAANTAGTGILNKQIAFYTGNQATGRDFNYAWLGGTGIGKHGDDWEIDTTDGSKGIVLHSPDDTRWRLTVSNAGAAVFTEIAFDPVVDMDWYAWYRADSAYTGGVADLADVTRWLDKSGGGRDLVIGNGTDVPTWENSLATLNNQPAVEFTSANSQSLENIGTVEPISITAATTYTWCAVVSLKTVATAMRIFGHTTTSTNRGAGITATPNWTTQMGATAASGGTPATATRYFVRVYSTSTAHTIYVNEVSQATTATTANTMGQIVVGAGRQNSTTYANYLNGYIGEIGVFSGDITASTRWADYKAYLNSRYGFAL